MKYERSKKILLALSVLLALTFVAKAQKTRELTQEEAEEKVASKVQESRTALVIGNGTYPNSPLKNPPNDAGDMTESLKALGFEVLSYTNLDQNGMKKAIREFGARLRAKGGVGLFYYAGHGVQSKGVNYLIPVGADVSSEEEVEYESVEVGLVLAQMEAAKNSLNIVILDACRNNPFARSYRSAEKGLASIDAPSGTLIAYATAPGSVASDGAGRNGLYTQELLKAMKTGGLSIEEVFKRVRVSVRGATADKQTPWESSSLTGNFYFVGNSPVPARKDETKPEKNAGETAFWRSIENSAEADDFEQYLKEYPSGIYAPAARLKLRKLNEKSPNTSSKTPETNANPAEKTVENKKPTPDVVKERLPQLLKEGNDAFNAGNYDLAITKYDEAYRLDPTWVGTAPVLLSDKSIALRFRGSKTFSEAQKGNPDEQKRKLPLARADFSDAAAAASEAVKILENAEKTGESARVEGFQNIKKEALFQRYESLRMFVSVASDNGRVAEFIDAFKAYNATETEPPKKIYNSLNAARTMRLANEYEAAVGEYDNILAANPDNLEALVGKGLALLSWSEVPGGDESRAKEAETALQRFVNLAPDSHPEKAKAVRLLAELRTEN